MASQAVSRGVSPISGTYGFVHWEVPFFREGQIERLRVLQGYYDPEPEDNRLPHRTIIEADFPFTGDVRVEITRLGNECSIIIASEVALPQSVEVDILEISGLLSEEMGFAGTPEFRTGREALRHLREELSITPN
jgi:hypothetical protein